MTGTFACPECGVEVTLRGATPGREVQCARCSTWVEVPYLPRAGVWTRPRFRRRRPSWALPLAWAAVGLLAAIVAVVAAGRFAASRSRAARESTLAEILAAADAAEVAGRADRALSEVEAALALLRSGGEAARDRDRVVELARRRDALSVREAEARIAGSAAMEPAAAVGDLLSLQARARQDRALDPLVSTVLRALEAARRRQVGADLAAARRARDEGRHPDALALGDRALTVADRLDPDAGRSAVAEAEEVLGPIVGRVGVIVAQLPGQFTLGTAESYDATPGAAVADALRRRGYAPRPARGPSRPLWDRLAPYRLTFQMAETQGGLYLQSQNRVSEVTAALALKRGREGVWSSRVTGRTQVPLPDLPAYLGTRLATAPRREPVIERRLYQSARAAAVDAVNLQLLGLPAP